MITLKPMVSYYDNISIGIDGSNMFIKKYTTEGFIRSNEMWEKYSHKSIDSFFNDFIKDYPDDFLEENCLKCYNEMKDNGINVVYSQLFDILIRRLVVDCWVGFKAEETLMNALASRGCILHDYSIIPKWKEKVLDNKYNIDGLVFKEGHVSSLIQVKNTSTFSRDGEYIKKKRLEFIDKERMVNEYINDGRYRRIMYYIYDKMCYIKNGEFQFFVNPRTKNMHFTIHDLINEKDGSMKFRLFDLKRSSLE